MRSRISTETVNRLAVGGAIFDTEVVGFCARRRKAGVHYGLKATIRGRQRWLDIGLHGSPWTAAGARAEAVRLRGLIAAGDDPASHRDRLKEVPTLAEAAERFLAEHVAPKRKPSTLVGYRILFAKHIVPRLGKRKLDTIDQADVDGLHHAMRSIPFQANRTLAVFSKLFAWSERQGLRQRGSNPVKGHERYREQRRERFLTSEELARLGDALVEAEAEGESPFVIATIRLLVLLGTRRGEIQTLKWSEVDLERGLLLLSDSKTGKKPVILNAPAMEILASLPRIEGNEHVVPGSREGGHLIGFHKAWARIRKRAGLDDVRAHDLRHSFASVAVAKGGSLPMIGRLLGHTQAQTTQRYAHLSNDPVRELSEAAGAQISASLSGTKLGATVVPLKRGS